MWRAAAFLCVFLAAALAMGSPPILGRRPAGWTVLLYIQDDCTQENCGRIAGVVEQFAQVGSSAGVEVLAFVDQIEAAPSLLNQPGMAGGRLFRVNRGALALVATYPGEPNMGSADTLAWALSQALEYSAREHLAVFTIGHGSPWVGLTPDASPPDPLTFEEYAFGLQRVFDTWGRRPDVLALTHCGTACVEALFALAPCARWILASEDLTTTESIPPAYVLRRLVDSPRIAPRALAQLCVDSYDASEPTNASLSSGVTLFDSCAMSAFAATVDRVLAPLERRLAAGDEALRCTLLDGRDDASTLACGAGSDCVEEPTCLLRRCCMIDIRQWCERLAQDQDPDVHRAGRQVASSLRRLTPSRRAAPDQVTRGGLSVYCPCMGEEVGSYAATSWAARSRWDEFLLKLTDGACRPCCNPPVSTAMFGPIKLDPPGAELTVRSSLVPPANTARQGWLLIRTAPRAIPLLAVPVEPDLLAGSGVLKATWDLKMWAVKGAASSLPLAVVRPMPLAGHPQWNVGLIDLEWRPTGDGAEATDWVPVTARCLVSHLQGDGSGRLLELRTKVRSDAAYRVIEPKAGDELRLPAPLSSWWEGQGEDPEGARTVTTLTGESATLSRTRLPQSARLLLSFLVVDFAGRLVESANGLPYSMP